MAQFFQDNQATETALDGCPDPTAGRAIIVSSSPYEISACHQLRDNSGNPIDLTSVVATTTTTAAGAGTTTTTTAGPTTTTTTTTTVNPGMLTGSTVFFTDALCPKGRHTSVAVIRDPETGLICFDIPEAVRRRPGVYQAEIIVVDLDGKPYVRDTTLLSVEPSAIASRSGPITIGQIRLRLRDWAVENTAFDQVEFKDAEILEAIIEPIRIWNETPPNVSSYTPSNFPMHALWLDGATAFLLRIAATWYMRNSQQLNYGDGKTVDDRNKFSQYAQLAEARMANFNGRVTQYKVAINWGANPSSLGGTVH